jgi:hypothetical protein
MRVGIILLLSGICLSGISYYIYHIDTVAMMGKVVLCPFRLITKLPCPGCGMSRAFLSIGQLKFQQAVNYNIFSPLLFLLMISYLIPNIYNSVIRIMLKYRLQWALLVIILINWGYRLIILHG